MGRRRGLRAGDAPRAAARACGCATTSRRSSGRRPTPIPSEPLPLLLVHDGPEYARVLVARCACSTTSSPSARCRRSAPRCCRRRATGTRPTPPRRATRTRSRRTWLPRLRSRADGPAAGADGREPRRARRAARALPRPGSFGGLFLQSGSFFRRRFDAHESGFAALRADHALRRRSVHGGRGHRAAHPGDDHLRHRRGEPRQQPRPRRGARSATAGTCARRAPRRPQLDLLARLAPPAPRRAPAARAGREARRRARDGASSRTATAGRPLLVFPAERGNRCEWEDTGMIGALAPLIEAGRVKVYCVDALRTRGTLARRRRAARGARAAPRRLRALDRSSTSCRSIHADCGGGQEIVVTGVSFGAYHAANFALTPRRPLPARDLHARRLRRLGRRLGRARRRRLLQQPDGLRRSTCTASTSTGCARACHLAARRRAAASGRTRPARSSRRSGSRRCSPGRGSRTSWTSGGTTSPHDWPVVAARRSRIICPALSEHPDRAAARHRGGLARRLRGARRAAAGPRRRRAHASRTERITNEPFDLRAKPRYALVIDRLGWWYDIAARVGEEGGADGRRLPAEQPVHVPGDGEALRLLRDDPARPEGAGDVDGAAQGADDRCRGASTWPRSSSTWRRATTSPFDLERGRASRSATRCT